MIRLKKTPPISRGGTSYFQHGTEALRVGETYMYIMDDFWHKNLDRIAHITGSFIEDFASVDLPIKATQARGYNCFLCFAKKIYSLWLVLPLSED